MAKAKLTRTSGISFSPETRLSGVILRSVAASGTTKNLLPPGFLGDSSSRPGRDSE
jgi:hypothetical protein